MLNYPSGPRLGRTRTGEEDSRWSTWNVLWNDLRDGYLRRQTLCSPWKDHAVISSPLRRLVLSTRWYQMLCQSNENVNAYVPTPGSPVPASLHVDDGHLGIGLGVPDPGTL